MTDWTLVGGDPAPGDPTQIRLRVGHLGKVEDNLRDVYRELKNVVGKTKDVEFRGSAAAEMRSTMTELSGYIVPIADSFKDLSGVMSSYAEDLEELQKQARRALDRATLAEEKRSKSESDKAQAAGILAQQRKALWSAEASEYSHSVASIATDLLDPGASAARAEEASRLSAASQEARLALWETKERSHRIDEDIKNYEADLSAARKEISGRNGIRERWDERSKQAANAVGMSLSGSLRSSTLEKFTSFLGDRWNDVSEFARVLPSALIETVELLKKFRERLGPFGWVLTGVVVAVGFIAALVVGIKAVIGALVVVLGVMGALVAAVSIAIFLGTVLMFLNGSASGDEAFREGIIAAVDVMKMYINKVVPGSGNKFADMLLEIILGETIDEVRGEVI